MSSNCYENGILCVKHKECEEPGNCTEYQAPVVDMGWTLGEFKQMLIERHPDAWMTLKLIKHWEKELS